MKFNIFLSAIIIAVFMTGCSNVPWITPPATNYDVVKTKSYEKPFDEVWGNILAFSAQNGMILKDVDKSNGLINVEITAFEDDIADCGKDSSMNVTERRGTINIFVNREKNAVVVTINSELKESRTMMTAKTTTTTTTTSRSKGVLEARILEIAGA
jgi:hypothetical protein